MNKKGYIQPEIIIVSVMTTSMMAGSISGVSGLSGLDMGGGTEDNDITEGGVKGDNGWDDIW